MTDTKLTNDILAAIEKHGGWRNILNILEGSTNALEQQAGDVSDVMVELRGIADSLTVCANNPVSSGGPRGLVGVMHQQAKRIRDWANARVAAAHVPSGMVSVGYVYSDLSGPEATKNAAIKAWVPNGTEVFVAAAHVPGGWQPIETAPRDVCILIAGGTYDTDNYEGLPFGVGIAYWYRDHWRGEDMQAHDEWMRHKPTHWQPLPPPPIAAAQGGSNE